MRNNTHRYLKIIGGFLSVKVYRKNNQAKISFSAFPQPVAVEKATGCTKPYETKGKQ